MTGEQHIDYDRLAQDAMRGIVRTVLLHIAKAGRLPGEHHFYIAFNTTAPGVAISRLLKAKYPEEMTIVMQHLFKDLRVLEERFEVTLQFGGTPERLVVPFAAIRLFFDPSVPYGLQFEGSDLAAGPAGDLAQQDMDPGRIGAVADGQDSDAPVQVLAKGPEKKIRATRKPRKREGAGEEAVNPAPIVGQGQGSRPRLVASKQKPGTADNDTKVVHLDAFRKK